MQAAAWGSLPKAIGAGLEQKGLVTCAAAAAGAGVAAAWLEGPSVSSELETYAARAQTNTKRSIALLVVSRTQEYTISYQALGQDHPPVTLTHSLPLLTWVVYMYVW